MWTISSILGLTLTVQAPEIVGAGAHHDWRACVHVRVELEFRDLDLLAPARLRDHGHVTPLDWCTAAHP
jgi:hypothetical protein